MVVDPMPAIHQVQPDIRRSSRVRTQTENYTPSVSGYKYSYAIKHLESQGLLNPDAHMFVQEGFYQAEPEFVTSVMSQLSLNSGLRAWGYKAYTAVQSDMKQLCFRNTFKPKHSRELTHTQRQKVLEYHMFVKEKRDRTIKGRAVDGDNKQRDYISKEDVSLPTVGTDEVLMSYTIDAEEERDVPIIDIPNAFI